MLYDRYGKPPTPPIIERTTRGATPNEIARAPEYLLRHIEELRLTEQQVARIGEIAAAYRRDIAPVQQKLDVADEAYQRYMEKAQNGAPAKQSDIETAGDEVKRLSGEMAAMRRASWQQATAVLTTEQQEKLAPLLEQVSAEDLR
jgi:hypothetical protein